MTPKLLPLTALRRERDRLRRLRRRVVFTNGTFDILHRGHVEYLQRARALGDALIVGLNTDASIRRIKGPRRPLNPQGDRAAVLAGLAAVDYVVFFSGNTPAHLIRTLLPDVLVKGADWAPDAIVGPDVVTAHGGTVRTIPLTRGRSTTALIRRVLRTHRGPHP